MERYFTEKTTCWVYITRNPETNETFIGYSLHLANELVRSPHIQLLYYRRFEIIHEAIGHKLLLEELSIRSLEIIINRMNPDEKDLRKEFNMYKP